MGDVKAERVCTFSGGFDSAAALLWSLQQGPTIGLFINYHQPYATQEWVAASRFANSPPVKDHPNWRGFHMLDMWLAMQVNTSWVPYRNLALAALVTNYAASVDAQALVFGSRGRMWHNRLMTWLPLRVQSFVERHVGEEHGYFDSTSEFFAALHRVIRIYTEPGVPVPRFELPLVGWNKKRVLQFIADQGGDLRTPWNCYREDRMHVPCGKCAPCRATQPLLHSIIGTP